MQTWMQRAQKELHAWQGKPAPEGLTNVLCKHQAGRNKDVSTFTWDKLGSCM